jgi:geranylgeranyl diphosphate synthase type II
VLIGGSLWLGAMLAQPTQPEAAEKLYIFGEKVGIAFQLLDDLLDVYANEAELGKKVGGDIVEGKNTYLWLRAMQKATEPQQKELNYWQGIQGMDDEKIFQIRSLYDQLGVAADTRQLAEQYHQEALAELTTLKPTYPGLQALEDYLNALLRRER